MNSRFDIICVLIRYLKNIFIGLIYPIILVLIISFLNFNNLKNTLISTFIFLSPLFFFIIIYIYYRNIYYITKIVELDNNKIIIEYYSFFKYNKIIINKADLSYVIRRDNSTLFNYYVLLIYLNNKLLIKQYQYDKWNLENFKKVAVTISKSPLNIQHDNLCESSSRGKKCR